MLLISFVTIRTQCENSLKDGILLASESESKLPTSDSLTGEARTFEKTKLISKGELLLRESWVESIALRSHRVGPNC